MMEDVVEMNRTIPRKLCKTYRAALMIRDSY